MQIGTLRIGRAHPTGRKHEVATASLEGRRRVTEACPTAAARCAIDTDVRPGRAGALQDHAPPRKAALSGSAVSIAAALAGGDALSATVLLPTRTDTGARLADAGTGTGRATDASTAVRYTDAPRTLRGARSGWGWRWCGRGGGVRTSCVSFFVLARDLVRAVAQETSGHDDTYQSVQKRASRPSIEHGPEQGLEVVGIHGASLHPR